MICLSGYKIGDKLSLCGFNAGDINVLFKFKLCDVIELSGSITGVGITLFRILFGIVNCLSGFKIGVIVNLSGFRIGDVISWS